MWDVACAYASLAGTHTMPQDMHACCECGHARPASCSSIGKGVSDLLTHQHAKRRNTYPRTSTSISTAAAATESQQQSHFLRACRPTFPQMRKVRGNCAYLASILRTPCPRTIVLNDLRKKGKEGEMCCWNMLLYQCML